MREEQIRAVKEALAIVFVPHGLYNIEEGMKLEQAAKAAIEASDAKYIPEMVVALRRYADYTRVPTSVAKDVLRKLPKEYWS